MGMLRAKCCFWTHCIDAPLALLVEKGWIRLLETSGPRGAGRPSERYLVRPAQKTQKPQKGIAESGSVDSVVSVPGVAGNEPRTDEVDASKNIQTESAAEDSVPRDDNAQENR
jgi:hypothetical protein